MTTYTIEVVPFQEYDWTFRKPGWLNLNPTAVGLISAFCGIALWMSLELLLLVYVTFKRRRGLYYWSIIVTTIGFLLQVVGYLLKFFKNDWPRILVNIVFTVGRVSNVTGFSVVLWSRLHLLVNNQYHILQIILGAIIINSVAMHVPTIIFRFYMMSPQYRSQFVHPLEIMEKVQQTVFAVQETAISGLYIWYAACFLKSGFGSRKRKTAALRLLIAVQVVAILLDLGLTVFDYLSLYTLKCAIHPFVYAVKLKMEFIVLNQLVGIVKDRGSRSIDAGEFGVGHGYYREDTGTFPRSTLEYKKSSFSSSAVDQEGGFVTRAAGMVKSGGDVALSRDHYHPSRHSAHILSSRSFTVESARSLGIQGPTPTLPVAWGPAVTSLKSSQLTTTINADPDRSWSVSTTQVQSNGFAESSTPETRISPGSVVGGEERDLLDMVGTPDDDEERYPVKNSNRELERRYLGRFGV
ncbi:hypothetical protein V8F20_009882 [Naviculisporaceae sp. PSN 640]